MTTNIQELRAQAVGPDALVIEARVERLTWHGATLRILDPATVIRSSQILDQLIISSDNLPLYSGKAVVGGVVNAGLAIICEVKLTDSGFKNADSPELTGLPGGHPNLNTFLSDWSNYYRVLPEFKVVVADMQMFLVELRQWLDRFELQTRQNALQPNDVLASLRNDAPAVIESFNALHERFEDIGEQIAPELRAVHSSFTKRQLHSLVMCSPFAHRTYHKPLGYAGDYEMVNMMLRDPFEGSTLYARLINAWFVSQWPAQAHRNRIDYLVNLLGDETLRRARQGKRLRVLNLGCGPAHEVTRFLATSELSNHVDLTLWDFNEETVERTGRTLDECVRKHHRNATIGVAKKSVHQVLKDGSRGVKLEPYDYIYCAGLFDYLSDRTCQQLVDTFYQWLRGDGLLVVTNVVDFRPFRYMLEHLLDWNLIYRDATRADALLPGKAPAGCSRMVSDETGVNLFAESRRPSHV